MSPSDYPVFGRSFAEQCCTAPDTAEEAAVPAKITYEKDRGGNLGCTHATLINESYSRVFGEGRHIPNI